MKARIPLLLAAAAALAATTGSEPPMSFDYDVVSVTRRLILEAPDGDLQLQVGDHARSGDVLFTARRSTAELAVSERSARFKISPRTRVRLAFDKPGVLLEVERGSVRGIFGQLPESDRSDRLVTTPSAVLAVRGTDYGVEVSKNGDTTVSVFEGIVEVRDLVGLGEPRRIGRNQSVTIRSGQAAGPIRQHGLAPSDWDRGRRPQSPTTESAPHSGPAIPGQMGPNPGGSSGRGGSKRHGG
jgi:hypothetical protein